MYKHFTYTVIRIQINIISHIKAGKISHKKSTFVFV